MKSNDPSRSSRRHFLQGSLAAAAVVPGSSLLWGQEAKAVSLAGKVGKTLKIGMVKEGKTLAEKFAAAKEAGFGAIEMNAPDMDVVETLQAIKETGLPVDGSVNSSHWKVRHSDPDAAVREKALESLKQALRQTKAVGGDTVLLVVGHGNDGTEEEVWKRSTENIAKAVPLAEELGLTIAIENVWNQFLYDHGGDGNQTAEKFVKYVDQFQSKAVAMQFDIGNHWKYGQPGDWIRTLGERVVKLDIKGFSREKGKFSKIGEGDLPWDDVCVALDEIGFQGWCAAEVGGGKLGRLKEVAENMDRALRLG